MYVASAARPAKKRVKFRFTPEFLRRVLMLPRDLEIENVSYDPDRRIITLHFSADKEVRGMQVYEVPQGAEIPEDIPAVWEYADME